MIYLTHSRFARARTAKVRINFGIQNQISQNYAKITLILNGFYPSGQERPAKARRNLFNSG